MHAWEIALTPQDWLASNRQATVALQRSHMNTLGLAVTFTSGVAATVAGTAWQIHSEPTAVTRWALSTLVLSILLTLALWSVDVIREPDPSGAIAMYKESLGLTGDLDSETTVEAYLVASTAAVYLNDQQLAFARSLARVQLLAALTTVALAAYTLWG